MADEKTQGADPIQTPKRSDDDILDVPRQDRQVSDEELDKISGGVVRETEPPEDESGGAQP